MKRLKKKDQYIVDDIFTEQFSLEEDNLQERMECLRNHDISRYRVKTIKSGNILESEIYPIWDTRSKFRKEKQNRSRIAQRNLNNKNAIK